MLRQTILTLATVGLLFATGARQAEAIEKVKVGAMHMCCPICEKTIYGLLKDVKGVTATKVSRTSNQVSFTTTGPEVTKEALLALTGDGYWGFVLVNSKKTKMPVEEQKIEGKWKKVVFKKVHLCCNACGTSIGNTVEIGQPKGGFDPEENDFNRVKGTASFFGEELDATELLSLMHKAGFHGVFDPESSEKAE